MTGKRLAARFILTALCALFSCLPAPRASASSGELGDLNGDGQVTAADAALLLRAADRRGSYARALMAADMTQNSVLNGVDARVILFIAAGKIPDLVAFVERVSTGLCAEALFDRFCYTGVERTRLSYRSENVAVTIERREVGGAVCYIADAYVQDITSFRTAFSGGKYKGRYQLTTRIALDVDAVVAVNGDFCLARSSGPLVRNGVWYRKNYTKRDDICVMTRDGVIRTYAPAGMNLAGLSALDPYQTFLFGPALLDGQGKAKTSFNSALTSRNPRTAIGYYEPGHYCLVVVDGRQDGYSRGMRLTELAALFESLGCRAAYNLDGGQTSMMATADGLINRPYRDGRTVSDIVYIGEPAA